MGQAQTTIIIRTCDICGLRKEATLVAPVSGDQLEPIKGWFLLQKEYVIGDDLKPIAVLVCGKDCALKAIAEDALELPSTMPSQPKDNVLPWERKPN